MRPAAYAPMTLILLLFGLSAASAQTIAPSPFLTELNNAGAIVNNGCIWTYAAGTSTPAATYPTSADASALTNANTNPIRTDSAGRFTAFLVNGNSYKFIYESSCTPPSHGTVYRTADNISAVPPSGVNIDVTGTAGETIAAGDVVYVSDGSGGTNAGQWYRADADFTYSSSLAQMVGIAPSALSSGASGTFRISGRVTGLTGLLVGGAHYVSSTAGALTSTAPTRERVVGVADSATSLVIAPNPLPPSPNEDPGLCDGRLTPTTGVPVTTTDVTAAATIYYTPYKGNKLTFYDGTKWVKRSFSELTISLAGKTASTPYDIFAYDSSGTVTTELVAWTSATARFGSGTYATLLPRQDGAWVKSTNGTAIDTSRKWLGTVYINGTGGQTDDTFAKRYIYNACNRVLRPVRRLETTDSWSWGTSSWQAANNSAANAIDVMVGLAEEGIDLSVIAQAAAPASGQLFGASIGEDSTSAPATGALTQQISSVGANRSVFSAHLSTVPAIGRHLYTWIEFGSFSGSAVTFYGDNGTVNLQSGLAGLWRN